MLYSIHKGFVDGYEGGQARIVHLVSSVENVVRAGLGWVFTDGHADIAYTDFFDNLRALDKIDWGIMQSRYWHDTDQHPDRKRKRQAEFLVKEFFPWTMIEYIGLQTAQVAKEKVS